MQDELKSFVINESLYCDRRSTFLAVSGGVDSVVMAHLFSKLSWKFSLVHCNFRLRGEESEQDQIFVKSLAKKYEVPYYVTSFDTNSFATTHKISIQMAARELRYQWFAGLIKDHPESLLATAHHLDDQVETMLFNQVKGTGLAGMHGISVKRDWLVRPLLFANRKQIEDYAREHQLEWREDSSNAHLNYQRNFIRREVVPKLKEINPSLDRAFSHNAEKFRGSEELLAELVALQKADLVQVNNQVTTVDKEKLKSISKSPLFLLALLENHGFNYSQCCNIIKDLDHVGRSFQSNDHWLVVDRSHLVITPVEGDFNPLRIERTDTDVSLKEGTLSVQIKPWVEGMIDPSSNIAQLDLCTITFPLELRKWKEGDVFYPLGMRGKKKISDYMIDCKIPLNLKKEVKVVVSGSGILWVVGHAIDDRYKITEGTTEILELKLVPGSDV